MTVFKSGARTACLALLIGMLAGCAGQLGGNRPTPPTSPADAAQQAAAQGHYEKAAKLYLEAAKAAPSDSARRHMRLEAGLAAAQGGHVQMAQPILAQIDPGTLDPEERARYNLGRTEIRIAHMPPEQALSHLPAPASDTPPSVAQRVWEKRADLHFASNDLIKGIRSLVQRDVWLRDKRAIRANDARIYDKALDAVALGLGPQSRPAENADATTRGWLALAVIGQNQYPSRQARDQALAHWQHQYPHHPANRDVLSQRFHYHAGAMPITAGPNNQPAGQAAPRPANNSVALALPMTGQFSSAAQAIRDGFMFAYHNSKSNLPPPQIYDTSSLSASDILNQAEQDQIGILVGPLDKPKVGALSRLNSNIPTVALNYSDQPINRPGFYQFALSPTDEARAVARHALASGDSRALALVPQGDWGSRVLDAFKKRFQRGGGQLVDYATYDDTAHDHSAAIKQVLQSYQQNPNSVDFIFVAAQPVQGRLIRSQLRYYHATPLPMFSTSLIYTGQVDTDKDVDLNSVHFVDMPWILGQGPTITQRRQAADERYGDEASDYARLFAMGMDAWLLTQQIAGPGLQTGDAFEGMTGVLSVQPDGRIERYLAWAVFQNGKPKLLQMPSTAETDHNTAAATNTSWAQP